MPYARWCRVRNHLGVGRRRSNNHRDGTLAEITRGDKIAIEMGGVHIAAAVVGTNLEQGVLGFVPLSYAGPAEDGTGFTLAHCRPPTPASEVLTVTPGKNGVKILKTVDSEAAITYPLTWESIAELKPKVLVLLREIKAERPHEYDYLSIWREYKRRLSDLVGWGAETTAHPELRSSAAYNIVYHKLLDNLKDPE